MEKIIEWLSDNFNSGYGSGYGDGYDDGYGYGYGSGCGSGYGYDVGSGYGSGSGSGSGRGFGFGSASGSGCGSGSGSGSASGYGSASGFGSGSGFGFKTFNGESVQYIDSVPTIIKHIKGSFAKGYILDSDFTIKPCYIAKGNGYFAHGETLHDAQEALMYKIFENMDSDEAIKAFLNKFKAGERYPGTEFFEWHHHLTGSCLMGRQNFVSSHELDLSRLYTVDEFITICKDDYGKDIIKQLKTEYEKIKM